MGVNMAMVAITFATSNPSNTIDLAINSLLQNGPFSATTPFSAHFAPGTYGLQAQLHGAPGDSCTLTVLEAGAPASLLVISNVNFIITPGNTSAVAFGNFTVV